MAKKPSTQGAGGKRRAPVVAKPEGAAPAPVEALASTDVPENVNPAPTAAEITGSDPSAHAHAADASAADDVAQKAAADHASQSGITAEVAGIAPPKPKVFIEPSVSRFVWYRSRRDDGIPAREHHPLSAQICGVVSDETVNIAVMGYDGSGPYPLQNVRLVQDGECPPGACTWMPYQKGQAAKTDAAEAAKG